MRKILELENYTSPQDSDVLPIVDTTNTTTKKISISLLKTVFKSHGQNTDTNLGTVGTKTSPVDNDKVLYRNSASSDALVTSTWSQIKSFFKTYFDTLYSAITHNHDSLYSAINHNHDSSYAPLTHASRHAVGGSDSVFPADPNANKYLKWNDSTGQLEWADVTVANADTVDGYHAGNSNGQVAVSNGVVCANLNADKLDSFHASQTPTANTIPVSGSDGKLDAGWLPSASGAGNFNQVEYTSSGSWTVPSGVSKIMVFAIAGGGGGAGAGQNPYNGGAGGTTSVVGSVSGTLVSLSGGIGGVVEGTAGTSYSGVAGVHTIESVNFTDQSVIYRSGFGSGSPFGGGGRSSSNASGESGNGYGSGGSGASAGSAAGGGGGSGQCVLGKVYSVSSGETLTITVGAGGGGGIGGSGGYTGGAGAQGFVRIVYLA